MSEEKLPICTTKMTQNQLNYLGLIKNASIKTIIIGLVGADCWAVTIVKHGVVNVKFNTYNLIGVIGNCFNQNHPNFIPDSQFLHEGKIRNAIIDDPNVILSELTNIGDYINIYMWGQDSWMIQITKTENGHEFNGYK